MPPEMRPPPARIDVSPPKLAAALGVLPEALNPVDALRLATIRGLVVGYHHRWVCEAWTVEEIEHEFHVPIVNPATGRRSSHFTHAGKFDGIVRQNGERYLLEHKTCSEDISPGSPYWKRLTIDTQISGYLFAAWLLGQRLHGVLYDVIRKPEIRPKKLSAPEQRRLSETREYFAVSLTDEEYARWAADPERRETPRMFEARLAHDTCTRPEWYFTRSIVTRLGSELLVYARELWQTTKEIHRAEKERDHCRNDRACMAYGRACEYLDLCARHDTPDNPHWKRVDSVHPELSLEDDTDGQHVLTHTRIATFNACRRKHHYRYELGLTLHEEIESLLFGSLLHAALAEWWTTPSDPAGGETTEPDDRDDAGEDAPQSCALACSPGLGEDQSRGDGARPRLPHDEERDGAHHAHSERPAPTHAVDAVSASD